MNTEILSLICAALAFASTAALGRVLIPALHKLKFGQSIIEDFGPTWHAKKQGTPTMGGIMFIIGIAFSLIVALAAGALFKLEIFSEMSVEKNKEIIKLVSCAFLALAFGAVGFTDDFIKVKKKRNLGLTEIQKTIPEIFIIAAFLACIGISGNTVMFVPGLGKIAIESVFGKILYFALGVCVIYGGVNAVNFTDGLDGLCAGVTLPVGAAFAIMAAMYHLTSVSLLSCALVGALGGYLIWNHYPAKVMMGDVGSNFLGGLVVALAYAIDCPLILLPVGIIYVLEGLSDVIQIGSIKLRHKKVFKMAPIHHHFEMCGWSEKKIDLVFAIVSVVGCAVGVFIFKTIIG